MTDASLRARKKQQSRQTIMDTALRLFAEHGFDRVTVAEIARQSDVSEATVFNYFPAKEDLIYARMEAFEGRLVAAVQHRPPGTSVLAAFKACLLAPNGLLRDPDSPGATDPQMVRTLAGIVAGSSALRARERQVYEDATDALARVIAPQSDDADQHVEPWVIANALMGVHRALVTFTRDSLLAGASLQELGRSIQVQADQAFALLERGLAG